MADRSTETARRCIVRGAHQRHWSDGMPEPQTPEYEQLVAAEQLRICRIRAGLEPDERTGGAFRLPGRNPYEEDR